MKPSALVALISLSLLSSAGPCRSSDLFNPSPATIDSPLDGGSLKRLTVNSDGKTPVVKNLGATWVKSLGDHGQPTLYTKANSQDFAYIGMPVGGIGAGELYLGGDGKLWDWDIFGTRCHPGPLEQGLAYIKPHRAGDIHDGAQTVLEQGFVIRTQQGGKVDTRTLDKDGFSDITFSGQYPIGSVNHADPASPVRVRLEAFSPFIPTNVEDSSYPATILNYTVENTSPEAVECTVGGWMENAAGLEMRKQTTLLLQNTAVKNHGYQGLSLAVKEAAPKGEPAMFDDFESGKYSHWTAEGTAFGSGPTRKEDIRKGTFFYNLQGDYLANSRLNNDDAPTGKLTSESFVIKRPYISFLIGGGAAKQKEYLDLVVDGQVVRTASGENSMVLRSVIWDVKDLAGKTAHFEMRDESNGWYGYILVDNIAFSDAAEAVISAGDQGDVGTMTLAVLGDQAEVAAQVAGPKYSDACLETPVADSGEAKVFGDKDKLVGAVRRKLTLAPGEKKTVSFIIAWNFPNPLELGLRTPTGRQYGARFKSAQEVADHLVTDFERLTKATRDWHDTWYDSTLPDYFLDRTFLNTSTLATSTAYLLSDGRFYAYEGRYSCNGTCTHVWGYQQALGYLFPDLEKAIMEKVEFVPSLGMNGQGGVAMRGEFDPKPPVDGQSGIILRTYLAHRMSADNSFLARNYASVKKAADYLITTFDQDHDGILEGPQANTMDAAWYGKITWLSLYYQAALRAAAEMADESHDADYAKSLRAMADKGRGFLESQLFNGEYFIHQPDPAHPESPGTLNGCPLEQLMGQNWAYQVGLGDIIDHGKALTALNSIWKYDYTTDTGIYRNAFKPGRWYAMTGEGGLIMCSFPHGGEDALGKGDVSCSAYDNECWTGSEYEETSLMMWDGLVDKALAEVKTIDERYDASKRNPWGECECGTHYSRAMAGYGVFTAACGFEYDGPKGAMAFAPRVNSENFKAAFTSAEGWGSYSQKYTGAQLDASLTLKYGKLRLSSLSLAVPPGNPGHTIKVKIDGKDEPVSSSLSENRISIHFASDLLLAAGQKLAVTIN